MSTQEQPEVAGNEENKQERAEYFDEGEFITQKEEVPIIRTGNPTQGGGGRVRISKIFEDHTPFMNKIITVAGWARNCRPGGATLMFIELNDGSTIKGLQIVINSEIAGFDQAVATKVGSSYKFKGTLVKSIAKGQLFELQLSQPDKHALTVFGTCDSATYPFAGKKMHSMEHLRQHAHLRARTQLMSSIQRIRNGLAYATHQFFQGRGFVYVHAPIITCSDCEGAGEMFQVSTLLPEQGKAIKEMKSLYDPKKPLPSAASEAKPVVAATDEPMSKAQLKKLAKAAEVAKKKADKAAAAKGEAPAAPAEEAKAEETAPVEAPKTESAPAAAEEESKGEVSEFQDFQVNYKQDFFGKPAFLTVSGQMGAENYACAMGDVYTFGPTFRAENSHTSRHLAEFWMIEPELAFINYDDLKDCAEDYLKFCLKFVLDGNRSDIERLEQFEKDLTEKKGKNAKKELDLVARLEQVVNTPFKRLTYTEAIELLQAESKKAKFDVKVEWGIDLGSEHERYLVEKIFKGPVILTDYPKAIKAFYMRVNEDGKTCQALDVLAPEIGEIIGGSMREERLEFLDKMIEEKGLNKEQYDWYRELR